MKGIKTAEIIILVVVLVIALLIILFSLAIVFNFDILDLLPI